MKYSAKFDPYDYEGNVQVSTSMKGIHMILDVVCCKENILTAELPKKLSLSSEECFPNLD